jgi:hypothetical protein
MSAYLEVTADIQKTKIYVLKKNKVMEIFKFGWSILLHANFNITQGNTEGSISLISNICCS